jgi:hypothetical protein
MASSSAPVISNPLYANAITEHLTKLNHITWRAQVLAVLRGARLEGHVTGNIKAPPQEIDGKEKDQPIKLPNPAYAEWYAADQQVLGFLLSSLSKDILPRVGKEIGSMFLSQTRARSTVTTRLQLVMSQKGNMSIAEYMNKMRSLGDEMTAAGRTLEDEELVEYIRTGIGPEYDPIVCVVIARTTPVTISELYSQLLSFETRLALMSAQEGGGSSANFAHRGCGHNTRGGFGHGGGGHDGSSGGGHGGFSHESGRGAFTHVCHNASNDKHPVCQVCKKKGHTADRCWHRFEEDYAPEERIVAVATGSHGDLP